MVFPDDSVGKASVWSSGDKRHGVRSLGQEYTLEEGLATYSSILAWKKSIFLTQGSNSMS